MADIHEDEDSWRYLDGLWESIHESVAEAEPDTAIHKLLTLANHVGSEAEVLKAQGLSSRWHDLQTHVISRGPREMARQRTAVMERVLTLADGIHADARTGMPPVAPGAVVIEAEKLQKIYRRPVGTFDLQLSRFSLRQGEILGVVGANGSGKSTLLRVLAGELTAEVGSLSYPSFGKGASWRDVHRRLAFVPQLVPEWKNTLEKHLGLYAALQGIPWDKNEDEVNGVLQLLRLEDHRKQYWREMSGGLRVRCALAEALVARPEVLILDEPLAPLDVRSQYNFLQHLWGLARSRARPFALIVSSHHLAELESIADQMLVLENGRVRFLGALKRMEGAATTHVFELQPLTLKARVQELFDPNDQVEVSTVGMSIVVKTPRELGREEMLGLLHGANIAFSHFRDVSRSSLRHLLLPPGAD